MEDIISIGVPREQMLRIGKAPPTLKDLGLHEQSYQYRRTRDAWNRFNRYSDAADVLATAVQQSAGQFRNFGISNGDLLDYLQYSDTEFEFYIAFTVPKEDDGMTRVGRSGKAISATYLLERWMQGSDAGIFKAMVEQICPQIWSMNNESRFDQYQGWVRDICSEQAALLKNSINEYMDCYKIFNEEREQKYAAVIKKKRIIGCTTTGAAKYSKELLNAKPGIIIVEEAGEILESHVLTALSENTKHIVLIGDHLQLRPKVNNYALTVERGDGFNLNVSLFERLVRDGYPHTTLTKQHRMRPEISALVRQLMYPNLKDDPKTLNRPDIRGLQSNVIFLNHKHEEVAFSKVAERRDEGSKASKQNIFEADMILKIVRYLAQQGYGTDDIVVLTPYLGQLKLLLDHLRKEHDPILNNLDSFELERAGLLSPASAAISKRRLRISTIGKLRKIPCLLFITCIEACILNTVTNSCEDNYQGEESDIVIASLTRSNGSGDIGFMAAKERVNVLLSRARDGLIVIGDASTFMKSRKGKDVWTPLFKQLGDAGSLFDGLPVKCEKHPQRTRVLKRKEDFETECPDGGCAEPW